MKSLFLYFLSTILVLLALRRALPILLFLTGRTHRTAALRLRRPDFILPALARTASGATEKSMPSCFARGGHLGAGHDLSHHGSNSGIGTGDGGLVGCKHELTRILQLRLNSLIGLAQLLSIPLLGEVESRGADVVNVDRP